MNELATIKKFEETTLRALDVLTGSEERQTAVCQSIQDLDEDVQVFSQEIAELERRLYSLRNQRDLLQQRIRDRLEAYLS